MPFKLSDLTIPNLIFQVYSKSRSKFGKKNLDATLYAWDIIASEKLIEFNNIFLDGFVALGIQRHLSRK